MVTDFMSTPKGKAFFNTLCRYKDKSDSLKVYHYRSEDWEKGLFTKSTHPQLERIGGYVFMNPELLREYVDAIAGVLGEFTIPISSSEPQKTPTEEIKNGLFLYKESAIVLRGEKEMDLIGPSKKSLDSLISEFGLPKPRSVPGGVTNGLLIKVPVL